MIAWLGAADLSIVAGIVALAALAQIVSGFGFALMAVPLMGLVIDIKTAVVVSTICGTTSSSYQAITDGRFRDRDVTRTLVVTSFLGMPVGLLVLDRVSAGLLQIAIGCLVLVALWAVVKGSGPKGVSPPAVARLAGFVSGVLATSTSTNGPPLVLLLKHRGLGPREFRATLNVVFCLTAIASIVLFAVGGRIAGEALVASAVALPGLGLGIAVGVRLRALLSEQVFWRIVVALLVATAVSSILSGAL